VTDRDSARRDAEQWLRATVERPEGEQVALPHVLALHVLALLSELEQADHRVRENGNVASELARNLDAAEARLAKQTEALHRCRADFHKKVKALQRTANTEAERQMAAQSLLEQAEARLAKVEEERDEHHKMRGILANQSDALEARLAKVPALVEALREIATSDFDDTEAPGAWARRKLFRAHDALAAWEQE
jgi:hypothetical protein